jgi:hypothetical protein
MKDKMKKRAKILSIIWLISYVVVGIFSGIYITASNVAYGINPLSMLSNYQLFVLVIVAVYFLPLLCAVHFCARKAEMAKLASMSRVVFVFLLIWTLALGIFTLISLFKPGTF